MTKRRGKFLVCGLWFVVCGLWFLTPRGVEAHAGPPYIVLDNSVVGPYTVTVWADPDTGRGTFIVEATLAGAATTQNTNVTLTVRPADGHRAAESATATRDTYDPKQFTAQLPFDTEGTWSVSVALDGAAGRGENTFDVQVTPPYPSWLLTLLCLLPFMGVGGVWLWAARRQHAAHVAAA